jgi:2OG-Fe(II) oxygenase superfamily
MTPNSIINRELFSTHAISGFTEQFNSAFPFKHLVVDNFLDPTFADLLQRGFPSLDNMKKHYSGMNEKKAEDNDFSKLDKSFTILHDSLSTSEFTAWLSAITGISPLQTAGDRLGCGLHQGGNGSFLDIHIDYNIHPLTNLQRKINFLLFLNPVWEKDWGGFLDLWDAKSRSTGRSICPLHNRVVIFECSELSFHGYSRIRVPGNITRRSYYQYYFTSPDKNISYHDTIFKPMPGTTLAKKIAVPVKDLVKNSIKKTLLALGWQKFLK